MLFEALIDKHIEVTSTACTSSYISIFIAIAHHHVYVLLTCMFRTPMEHDVMLCKEVRLMQPFKAKKGSLERGRIWNLIAEV